MSKVFEYFKIIGNLKRVDRTGWVRSKVKNPESVAEHMYRMAMMSFAIPSQTNLDREKCMKMALVHDMAESVVGDITPWCGISKEDKQKMEEKATAHICSLVGEEVGKDMYNLWMEYETQSSPEAQFVKDLDKFEMLVQAFEYEQLGECPGRLQDFYDHTKAKYSFSTNLVRNWCDDLMQKRAATLDKSGHSSGDSLCQDKETSKAEEVTTSSTSKKKREEEDKIEVPEEKKMKLL